MKRRSDNPAGISRSEGPSGIFAAAQAVLEALIIVAVFSLVYYLYHEEEDFRPYLHLGIIAAVAAVVIFERLGLYGRREASVLNVREIGNVGKGAFLTAVVVFASLFYLEFRYVSRVIVTVSLVVSTAVILAERVAIHRLGERRHLAGKGGKRILIYGAGEVGRLLARRMVQSPFLGFSPVGFVDDDPEKAGGSIVVHPEFEARLPVLGSGDEIPSIVEREMIDEVLIAVPNADHGRIMGTTALLRERGIPFRLVPFAAGFRFVEARIEIIDGIPLINEGPLTLPLRYRVVKRVMDLAIGSALILILSPLWILLSLLVRIVSPGPILFRHERIGAGGKPFTMYKFRTMRADSAPYEETPSSSDDPRITRMGRLMRRTSLDELPQLINVVKGEMSLVGPRPEMPFIVEKYTRVQRLRLAVKPGLTGLWQLSADRKRSIHENLDYDLFYIKNASILLDLVILAMTPFRALRGT